MVMKDSMTESVLNLICRWQLKLDPADVTQEAPSKFFQTMSQLNAQRQVNNSMKKLFEKIKYRMDINEPKPRGR
jgi:hypothetical protein